MAENSSGKWNCKLVSVIHEVKKAAGLLLPLSVLSYEDLRESPEFSEVWQSVKTMLTSADCVVIHNAPFDLRHLHNILSLYHLPSVSFDYVCSFQLCRHHFPDAHSHSLNCMADMFGITFQHHDALEDAETCVKIASHLEIPENFICRFEYLPNV